MFILEINTKTVKNKITTDRSVGLDNKADEKMSTFS
jgi:hypothetical protein